MIRSTNHSSYPLEPTDPTVEQLRETQRAHASGDATDAELRAVEDEVAAIVVAEQSRAFVNLVTDGMTRWTGPVSHIASCLEGLETGEEIEWPGTPIRDRRPVCTGPVARRGPFLLHDLKAAMEVAQTPVRVVLPGPVSFARLTEDRHHDGLASLAESVAAALAAEVAALAAAGARHFQLDEPLLASYPGDLELIASTAARVLAAAGEESTTVLATWGRDLSGFDGGSLGRLPGTHLGLDLVAGGAQEEVIAALPAGKGVFLGVFDAGNGEVEDAAEVAGRLTPLREHLVTRDVLVGPQHGLAALSRDDAFDKLLQARYLTEKLEREWDWSRGV